MTRLVLWFKHNKTYGYLLLAFLIGFAFLLNVLFTIQLKFENSDLNNQIAELNNRLKGEEQNLQQATSDASIEKLATERLGMVKSGDTPVKIYVENQTQNSVEEQNSGNSKQDKIRIYLKDWYEQMKIWVNKK